MVSSPHGGRLVQLEVANPDTESLNELMENPSVRVSGEVEATVSNIACGVLSPLEGFMGEEDYRSVIDSMRLTNDAPWTIPILLHVPEPAHLKLHDEVTLLNFDSNKPVAVISVEEMYRISKSEYALRVFGTEDQVHPVVA